MRAFDQRKKDSPASTSFFGPKIQKKLKTGTVGDRYEVEADNVADKVLNNKPSGGGLLQSKEEVQQKSISATISSVQAKETKEEDKSVQKKSDKEEDKKVQKKSDKKEEDKTVQKKCAECEKEDKVQKKDKKEEEKPVQKKGKNTESEIQDNELEGKLDNSKGGGNSLDKKTKGEMESGFGADFSNVKIHTDSNAVHMSQELGAQAFTNGNDVYFNKGKYNPDSKEGKHLLAHELTHTVQQTGARQKSGTIQKKSIADHHEDLQTEKPEFKGNPPLEKANDNQMLISTGQKGEYITDLQEGLKEAHQKLPNFGADGDFGNETKNAVVGFQRDNHLNKIDGIVGPETMGALDNKIMELKGGGNCCAEGFQLPQNNNEFEINNSILSSSTFCSKGSFKIASTADWVTPHNEPHYHIIITAIQGGTIKGPTVRRFDVGRTETQSFPVTTKDCIFFKVEIKVINPNASPKLKGSFNVTN
jgi:peptidoglycan hydrolase-like protein with peptidoglycan-binding domain